MKGTHNNKNNNNNYNNNNDINDDNNNDNTYNNIDNNLYFTRVTQSNTGFDFHRGPLDLRRKMSREYS